MVVGRQIDNHAYKVVYVIVSKKDKAAKSKNLPLFSRISLMRSIKGLKRMSVETVYCFVEDQVAKKAAMPKPKKKRKAKATAQKTLAQTQAYNFPVNDYSQVDTPDESESEKSKISTSAEE